jgi:hypothetical protein
VSRDPILIICKFVLQTLKLVIAHKGINRHPYLKNPMKIKKHFSPENSAFIWTKTVFTTFLIRG